VRGELAGQRIINTFGYLVTAVAPPAGQASFFDDADAYLATGGGFYDKLRLCLPTNYMHRESWWQVIAPTRFAAHRFTHNEPGTGAGLSDSPNIASTITRRGDVANRANVSSLHLAVPTTVSAMANGMLLTPVLDALNDFCSYIEDDIPVATGAATLTPVIPHMILPNASVRIDQAFPQDTVRVMRRRTVRLGE
jgi:hypothetical protein